MLPFNITKLETPIGILRLAGEWDPLTAEIQLIDIAELGMDGWADVSFWLTEQEFESEIAAVLAATKMHLLAKM